MSTSANLDESQEDATSYLAQHFQEPVSVFPTLRPRSKESHPADGACDDEELDEPAPKMAKIEKTSTDRHGPIVAEMLAFSKAGARAPVAVTPLESQEAATEEVKPYPLEKPCYQKMNPRQSNAVFSGTTLAPPLQEVYWPMEPAKSEDLPKSNPRWPIGGLRHLAPTIRRLPVLARMGGIVYSAINDWLASEEDGGKSTIEAVLSIIGSSTVTKVKNEISRKARRVLFAALKPHAPNAFKNVVHPTQDCPVNTELLHLWVCASQDPDELPVQWLRHGAPAGIIHAIESRGIFMEYDPLEDVRTVDPEQLRTDPDHANYDGVEEDEEVAAEIKRFEEANWTRTFDTLEEATKYVKGEPILSRLGVIKKMRNGKWKNRLVVDSKRSEVSGATRKFERTMLPRGLDVCHDTLDLMASSKHVIGPGEKEAAVEYLIADFKDAFFILPNHPEERRYFVIMFRGKYIVFLKTTQGSRGAPLTWARLAALVARFTQAVIGTATARISTYVDDPIVVSVAPKAQRDKTFAMVLLLWSALDLPLSLTKAVRGFTVSWTSAKFTPYDGGLQVEVKETIVKDAQEMTTALMQENTISRKKLRSYVGKLMHIASVVQQVRPFLADLYGALYAKAGNAPRGLIWTKQIWPVLCWMNAMLATSSGKIVRKYDLAPYLKQGRQVTMDLDASPWGIGGYLTEDGKIVSWFASALSGAELVALGISLGDCAAQQTVEALAALVALRSWSSRWLGLQPTIRVRSDSISALTIVLKLKTKGKGPGIVARDMALDISDGCYQPLLAEHVPGVENTVADMLSRKFMPPGMKAPYVVPACLWYVEELLLPMRDKAYFRSLSIPVAPTARQ